MKILRIIGVIIELIIAVAIFIIIAQKTPLFERIISGSHNTSISSTDTTPLQSTDATVEKKKLISNTVITGEISSTAFQENNEAIPVAIYSSNKGCTTPRGAYISENQSVTAYSSSSSTTNNICNSELRVCRQGKLSGTFTRSSCGIIVDGERNGKDMISGASDSTQHMGDGAVKISEYLKTNKEYIQPQPTIKSKELVYNDTQYQPMENKESTSMVDTRPDFLDQEGLRNPHTNNITGSCITPRGDTVSNGDFVYAYDIDTSDIQKTCKLEKRSCINSKLSGTYTKKPAMMIYLKKNKTSDTLQSLAWKENDRLGRQVDPIVNNGTLSPGGPTRTQSFSDLIRKSVTISKYGIKGIRTGPNIVLNTTNDIGSTKGNTISSHTIYYNTQNYIAYASCLSPRGTPLQHGQHITAYRNRSVERNSLCDSEIRTCRDGKLRGSYQYQSCNPNTKPVIKKNTGRYPGKIILNTAETVIDTVKHTSKSVWDWIKGRFR